MNADAILESLLFVASRPLSRRRLRELGGWNDAALDQAVQDLQARYTQTHSGLRLLAAPSGELELVTHPDAVSAVQSLVRTDAQGELSRAALETLTILAYRGPLTRPELEQIRGVQSSLILRNLLLRGLVEQREDHHVEFDLHLGQPVFLVTGDFLKHLGLAHVEDLPGYEQLHGHSTVTEILSQLDAGTSTPQT